MRKLLLAILCLLAGLVPACHGRERGDDGPCTRMRALCRKCTDTAQVTACNLVVDPPLPMQDSAECQSVLDRGVFAACEKSE